MRKLLLVIMLLGLVFSMPTLSTSEKISKAQSVKKNQNKRCQQLEKHLFAVHTTHSFPQNGILKAGLFGKESMQVSIPTNLIPDFRCTVHFSLGEMVRPVEGVKSWEKCPFAVVVPLSDLTPQLLNINCYDTFVLGDYTLSKNATLVLPITYKQSLGRDTRFKLQYYDPTKTTLRKTVELVIQKAQGWQIHMLSNDVEDKLNKAYLNQKNINTFAFFAPLVKKYPYLSVGCRFDKVHGKAYQLGKLEVQLFTLCQPYLYGKNQAESTDGLQEQVEELEKLFSSTKDYVKKVPFDEKIKSDFHGRCQNLAAWLNIMKADMVLQASHKATLVGASQEIWREVDNLKYSPDELHQYLMSIVELLPEYEGVLSNS